MKNLDLNSMGVHEMNICEMQETDGGIIWFVVIAAAVFLTSCNVEANFQVGGSHNSINTSDSTQNGWSADSTNVNISLKPL
ncbi:MAG: hypothetical protein JXR90_03590 [Spirochaetes bacterium]|nr:hypothetical protein [Spirochaetota bacterium]